MYPAAPPGMSCSLPPLLPPFMPLLRKPVRCEFGDPANQKAAAVPFLPRYVSAARRVRLAPLSIRSLMNVPVYISQPQPWIPTTEPFIARGSSSAFAEPELPAHHDSCAGDSGRFSGI